MRSLFWIGTSLDDLKGFPEEVRKAIGFALQSVQEGRKPPSAKPLKGFGGATVLEIVEDFDSDTYRAVYTVRLRSGIYVLHVFQKKSPKGIKTPKREIDLIHARMNEAIADDKKRSSR